MSIAAHAAQQDKPLRQTKGLVCKLLLVAWFQLSFDNKEGRQVRFNNKVNRRVIRPCRARMSSPSHHDPQDDVLAHVLLMFGEVTALRLFLVLARVNDDPNPPDILRRVRHSGFDSGEAAVSMLIQACLPSCALTKRTNRTLITKGLFRSSGCSA